MANELTRTEYEKRFWQRWGADYKTNFLGFGVDNPWQPPIQKPTSMLAAFDKRWLTTQWNSSLWAWAYFFFGWLMNSGTGDSLDWYWYNNGEAAGAQMYPTGVNKYYDMYSFDGFIKYYTTLLWYEFCNWIGVMFLYGTPLDLILDWINGLSFDNAFNIIWYYIPGGDWMVWGWNLKVQDGWNMM